MPIDITEYPTLGRDSQGNVIPCGIEPGVVHQQVDIGGTSDQSAAFSGNTRFVRLHADAPCRIAFGSNPTAAATTMRLAAGASEYFGVTPGHKLAVITST